MKTSGSAAARQRGQRQRRQKRQRSRILVVTGLALFLVPATAGGQSMAQRAQVRDGKVRLSYATRPEVCGNGRNVHIVRSTDDWISDCQHGPALVALEWRAGTLVDVDTYVGGRWRAQPAGVVDLGTVRPADAVAFLLDLAGRVPGGVGHELIFPAIIADSIEVWPRLLALARNNAVPRETRKAAVFWLGQAVGERAVEGLTGLTADGGEDVDVQEHAVFALSQLHDGAGVPSLIEIARSHANPKVRKAAMFWLGQSNDPRALALFEEILRSR